MRHAALVAHVIMLVSGQESPYMEAPSIVEDPLTTQAGTGSSDLRARVAAVAVIAARYAREVDAAARFPSEAFAAARAERLLGIMVPRSLGGEGANLGQVA